MNFEYSDKVENLIRQVRRFMEEHIFPNEALFHEQVAANRWETPAIVNQLKEKAREAGLWNLFLPVEYAERLWPRKWDGSPGLLKCSIVPPLIAETWKCWRNMGMKNKNRGGWYPCSMVTFAPPLP